MILDAMSKVINSKEGYMLDKTVFTKVVWLCDRPLYEGERNLLEQVFPDLPIEELDTGDAGLSVASAMTLLHGCSNSWLPVIGARTSLIVVLATQGYRFAYLCESGTPPYDDEVYYVKEREQELVIAD
jgi:hypothetical protein